MLRDVIVRIVPIRYRQSIGLWTIRQAGRFKVTLYLYLLILCGHPPENMRLTRGNRCIVRYRDRDIVAPRDGALTFMEVLQDEVYEKSYRPQEGDVVIDIGAYVGMFTVKASLSVGNKGRVIAVEPSPLNWMFLRDNTRGLSNVTIVSSAASSYTGKGRLTKSGATPCFNLTTNSERITEEVDVETVDCMAQRLDLEKVDFIKIDAEGMELEILRGALGTMRRNRVRLAIAAYHNLPSGEPELPALCRMLILEEFDVQVEKGYIYADNHGRRIKDA